VGGAPDRHDAAPPRPQLTPPRGPGLGHRVLPTSSAAVITARPAPVRAAGGDP
jgi:hypothetical protein